MPRMSAGILLFKKTEAGLEVFLVHMGGPFWARKDDGAWSIPKGEIDNNEDPLDAAKREFGEEVGALPAGDPISLATMRQPGGKIVHCWAIQADFDPASLTSNSFRMQWPPNSGKYQEFPEVDRAAWFSMEEARRKILSSQVGLLDEVTARFS